MKSSFWKKTTDDPDIAPDVSWDVELEDIISIDEEAGGWAVSLVAGQGVEEGRGKRFGKKWYPSQAEDVLERDLKSNGFTSSGDWQSLRKV